MLKNYKFNLLSLVFLTFCFISCENATQGSSNQSTPKKTTKSVKLNKNQKSKTKKVKLSAYWLAAKKELKITNQQIAKLKKARNDYSKKVANSKSQKQKNNLLKLRSNKEIEILGSVKNKKAFSAFNKKWKSKNGK